jgi:hypothetical protein
MSPPGRSQGLMPERFKREGTSMSPPGRSQGLMPERFKREGTPVSPPGRLARSGSRLALPLTAAAAAGLSLVWPSWGRP